MSIPIRSAIMSISVSWAMAACGTPKPRNAPAGVPLVKMPAEVACTAGTKYGPVACTGTRSLTVMPHDV